MSSTTSIPFTPASERRYIQGVEYRAAPEKAKGIGVMAGYAAVFDSTSVDLGGFFERIRPGAFRDCLARGSDILALAHHESSVVLGRRSSGTLEIAEDSKGLAVMIQVPDTTGGRDTLVSVQRGDLNAMSFQFRVVEDEWSRKTQDGRTVYLRELIKVDFSEVSIVAFPAYTATTIAEARSAVGPLFDAARKRLDVKDMSRRDATIARGKRRMDLWTRA